MVLGRLAHYAVDAALLSTIFAGIKRTSGFEVNTTSISDDTFRSVADKYLTVGESIYDFAQAYAVNSSYWKRKEEPISTK
ncbi:hypothetical protein FRB94_005433 [Tulasnella sp. JGI-2019a]|nr:hypothetical protein FRB93_006165 [Tulasnella sp. JGI-2019a]KAG9000420.1 hypothetical protein FRB94_005433 [Tulasnella sp. JGI-2019a]KAG9028325.1 hypothetical protein FRB95_006598 [Tulasnella sp. JGI-2019a]